MPIAPRTASLLLLLSLALTGCADRGIAPVAAPPAEPRDAFYLLPLPVQQSQAYPDLATGRFHSLADFEDLNVPGAVRGVEQVGYFTINPLGGGAFRHSATSTRTGAGALRATLEPGASLVFRSPFRRNFSEFTLLSLSVWCPHVRDDLAVTLHTQAGSWTSRPLLTPTGWSTVLIDLARLAGNEGIDLKRVETVELRFTAAAETVEFGVDDVMVIDNARRLPGTPGAIAMEQRGLDWTIRLPGWAEPLRLAQCDDGLWRLGDRQAVLTLDGPEPVPAFDPPGEPRLEAPVPPPSPAGPPGEDLRLLGDRRVGRVEVLEANSQRLRLRNTWYFPPVPGEWIDMDVRRVEWEYTFYPDGRYVTHVRLHNAGGNGLKSVRIALPEPVAWSDGRIAPDSVTEPFDLPAGTWSCLAAPPTEDAAALLGNFARPAAAHAVLAAEGRADGDENGDGFDESQGCYYAVATGGQCRLELGGDGRPLLRPVVRAAGPWRARVLANCQGLPLDVARLPDGALATVPERLSRPALVEFTGPVGALDH